MNFIPFVRERCLATATRAQSRHRIVLTCHSGVFICLVIHPFLIAHRIALGRIRIFLPVHFLSCSLSPSLPLPPLSDTHFFPCLSPCVCCAGAMLGVIDSEAKRIETNKNEALAHAAKAAVGVAGSKPCPSSKKSADPSILNPKPSVA